MKNVLTIKKLWTSNDKNTGALIIDLKQQLERLKSLPESVTLISAGEVKPLLEPEVSDFYLWLKTRAQVQFVSVACVSLHGALLEFYHSHREHGLIISLELSKEFQQACLNSLGIGVEPEQDGLNVVAGVGYLVVGKQFETGDKIISDCQILSQPKGLMGISEVINKVASYVNELEDEVVPISFSINSEWGEQIQTGLKDKLKRSRHLEFWLPSIEADGNHYLSLKPFHEISIYDAELQLQPLAIFTLGGGGRVGWLKISTSEDIESKIPAATFDRHSLKEDLRSYSSALALTKINRKGYYEKVRETLKYPRSSYRGVHNHYFQWNMGL